MMILILIKKNRTPFFEKTPKSTPNTENTVGMKMVNWSK